MQELHEHHDSLILGFYKQFEQIFKTSNQAIYLYLDDEHKICNKKFASLLGYNSPAEWAAVKKPFDEAFVAKESQDTIYDADEDTIEYYASSSEDITWRKKDGSTIVKTVTFVPIIYQNHPMTLHFVY